MHAPDQPRVPNANVGSIFMPINDDKEGDSQHIWKVEKDDQGQVTRERLFGVRYVPLTDAPSRT